MNNTLPRLSLIHCFSLLICLTLNQPVLSEDADSVKAKSLKGHNSAVSSLAYSGDGKLLVSGSWDNTAKVWNPTTGKELLEFIGHGNNVVTAVAITANGKIAASGDGDPLDTSKKGTIRIWDPATGKEMHILAGHSSMIYALAFSPDGSTLASASGEFDKEQGKFKAGEIKLWDTVTWKERVGISPEYKKAVLCIAFSPNGESIVAGSGGAEDQRDILIYDVKTGKKQGSFVGHKGPIVALGFSKDGKTLMSAGTDLTLRVWSVEKKEVKQTIKPHEVLFVTAAISPDGKTLVSGSHDKTVKIWNVETGKCLLTFKEHTNTVAAVVFSPDGQFVATGGNDSVLRLIPIPKNKE